MRSSISSWSSPVWIVPKRSFAEILNSKFVKIFTPDKDQTPIITDEYHNSKAPTQDINGPDSIKKLKTL